VPPETILVLGGTAEANALVRRVAADRPQARVVLSLAGRTAAPTLLPVAETRIGGFGGPDGLASFLSLQGVTRLVDATHPFAVGISRNARAGARLAGVPRIALVRPAWEPVPGDRWIEADCLLAAAQTLPAGAQAFLALGRQHLAPFAARQDVTFVVRMIDPPAKPLPFPATLVLGRPEEAEVEEALFRRLAVTHLVARNSGGALSYAKIEAARRLGLPVVMIRRMAAPEPPVAPDVEAVMRWLSA
jgi:precorrin-6A/cobalt-precorrin-6A reductase